MFSRKLWLKFLAARKSLSGCEKVPRSIESNYSSRFVSGAIDGGFGKWSAWSACSEPKYCLQGVSKRTRTCTNPSPANGGDECAGLVVENKDCPTPEDSCTGNTAMAESGGLYVQFKPLY